MKMLSTNPARLRGFTLVELIVTVAVLAILLSTGIPSFLDLIRNNQTASETNRFVRDLNYARSEAVKRGEDVVVCTANSNNPLAGCTAATWENGWMIFVDLNADRVLDGGTGQCLANEDCVLKVNEGLDPNFTITESGVGFQNFVAFVPNGTANAADVFRLCRPNTADLSLSRAIGISATGRINIQTIQAAGLACP